MGKIVHTGEKAGISGIYKCLKCESRGVVQQITLSAEDTVPPCRQCDGISFELVQETQH